jgi:hypothetical protein
MIAYWTSIEPNIDRLWLDKNRAVFFFHPSEFSLSWFKIPVFSSIGVSPGLPILLPTFLD